MAPTTSTTTTVYVRGPAALGVGGDMSGNAVGPGSQVTNIQQLIQQFGPTEPHQDPVDPAEAEAAITCYRDRLRQAYGRLDLEVLLPTTEPEHPQVGLREVFVPPLLRPDPPRIGLPPALAKKMADHGEAQPEEEPRRTEGQKEAAARRRGSDEERPPTELLRTVADPQAKRLVLLGNPGAGKSTLTRYLALALTSQTPPESLAHLAGRLPVIVELRRYAEAEWRERTFEDFLEHLSTMEDMCVPRRVLDMCLRSGRAVVIFDGLDELFDPAVRAEVSRRIAAFAARYDQARIIVTSRVIGYQRAVLDGVGFQHHMIQDLSEEQIQTFVRLWYDTVCPHDARLAERLRQRITASVAHSRPVRELAGNPLLLTILAIIGRRQELPRDRQGVYEHAVNVLIAHWDLDAKHLPPLPDAEGIADLDVRHRRELLRLLARQMQDAGDEGGGNLIHGSDLQATFCKYLTDMWEFPPLKADAAARAMLRQFQERNFILSHFGGEVYGFVHRTFLEYLAAADLAQRYSDHEFTDDQLIDDVFARRAGDSTWHEVLLLLVGQLHERVAARAIDKLLELHAADPDETEILALAVRCLAEVRSIGRLVAQSEAVMNAVIIALEDRRAAPLMSAVPALGGFGQHWSGRRIYLHWFHMSGQLANANGATAAAIACTLYQDPGLPEALAVHSHNPVVRNAALRSLAERWPDHEGLDELLRGRAESDTEAEVRGTAIDLLGKRRTGTDELRTFLFARVVAESDEGPRVAALDILAEHWADDPEVLRLHLARGISLSNWRLEEKLVRSVAARWKADPEVARLLMSRAAADSYWAARDTALQVLAQRWPDDPAVVDVLRARVADEPDGFVRATATTQLADLFPDEHSVRDLLQTIATTDPDHNPRYTAQESLADHWRAEPAVRELLLDRACSDPHEDPRAGALELLDKHWHTDPEVRALLRDRVTGDPHESARLVALELLTKTQTEAPQGRELLLERAAADPAAKVRHEALKLLVKHWPQDPAVRGLLMDRAATDLHEDPRTFALTTLAKYWFEDADVRALLQRRAVEDLHRGPRRAAVESLVFNSGKDPEVRDLLLDRARTEVDEDVQGAVLDSLVDEWPDDPAVNALVRTLATTGPVVSFRAGSLAWLAWRDGGDDIAELLRDRATADPSAEVRIAALVILAFGWPTHPEALAVLRDRAAHDERNVMRAAEGALAIAEVLAGMPEWQ